MVFFNERKMPVEIKRPHLVSVGDYGRKIYSTKDGKYLKTYTKEGLEDFDLSLQKRIQTMGLDNVMKVEEFLFDKNGAFKAELMPFYETSPYNLLFRPSTYFVGNMYSILDQFLTLADEAIKVFDVHSGNIIQGPEKMMVIDTDMYCYAYAGAGAAKKNNVRMLTFAVHDLLLAACEALVDEGLLKKNNFDVPEPYENIHQVLEEMTHYDYPIDYVRYR